jgi:hypothetical protein
MYKYLNMQQLMTENQLNDFLDKIYREEQIKFISERLNEFSDNEREFVLEYIKNTNKKVQISEARWWNIVGDLVGIIDPTGIVDVVNALDYFRQGDNLFGILSLISAVPYVGDIVGKPIVLAMKAGGDFAKAMRTAKTAEDFAKIGIKYPMFGKLFMKLGDITSGLFKIAQKTPIANKLTKRINQWVGAEGLFTKAAKEYKYTSKTGTKIAGDIMKDADKISLVNSISDALKLKPGELRAFRDFGKEGWWGLKKLLGSYWWKNYKLSSLLLKTKFWLRFLDKIGVANFVGPAELAKQIGDSEMANKFNEYMETPEAQQEWNSEMGNLPKQEENTPSVKPTQQPVSTQGDKTSDMLVDLFGFAF